MQDPDVSNADDSDRVFLTTKEVADLLRVKERKVYDLAAEGGIPHSRITGKLLFPRNALLAWISGGDVRSRPNVVTGSHDPLLDWALGASGAQMATLWNGSGPGLEAFMSQKACLAALHLPQTDGWNVQAVQESAPKEAVLVHWAKRQRGLLISPNLATKVTSLTDLAGHKLALRQPGAGASVIFERLCEDVGMRFDAFETAQPVARTEAEAAGMVARGEADAALGIAAMARSYSLGFVPLMDESVDLLLCRRQAFDAPCDTLLRFAKTPALRDRAEMLGGYDVSEVGQVRWLGP